MISDSLENTFGSVIYTYTRKQALADGGQVEVTKTAQEAAAVNEIKWYKRFTVVIGNPPYSKISSNLTPEMRATVERYRYLDGEKIKERGALQFEINLQDDYVKFFRLCEGKISASNVGVLGLITNNGYLSTPTLRGMRDSLLETFSSMWVLDLHGHVAKGEIGPDGAQEENVFDIVQGVSVFLGGRTQPKTGDGAVLHAERYGSRAGKYSFLQSHDRTSTSFAEIAPSPPFYLFVPHDADLALEWKQYVGLAELFPKNSAGIITARDGLVIAENKRELAERLDRFSHAKGAEESIYEEFGFSESKRFNLREAQSELRKLKSFSEPIRRMLHRPFDERFVFFNRSVVWSLSRPMADQMEDGKNLALVATRQVTRPQFEHAYVSRHIIEIKACSHDRNTQIFPLFICGSDGELALSSGTTPNLNPAVLAKLAKALGLKLNSSTRELGKDDELSPLLLFNFAYAILHCPSYRERYFEFLRSDFPRLPVTGNLELFRALARLGSELTALHLLESPKLEKPITEFIGGRSPIMEKVSWSKNTVWLDKEQTIGFQGVREDVWNFHIGGYQVCEKWLKDRKGRNLTAADRAHYQKIIVALSETIRLMKEIDAVIEKHGGWPLK
jgi:predicted helicase